MDAIVIRFFRGKRLSVWRVSGHTKTFKWDNSEYTTRIGGQHYITLPEDVATSSICAKQDTHRITEMQLLMSGVEPNPGPGPNNGMVSLNAGVVHSEYQANKSQSASNHPDKVKYENHLMRLASFGNKAHQFPLYSTTRLAQHGLYATEVRGQLKCFSCDFVYNPTDHMDPIIMHNQVKNCGYLNSYRYPKEPVYQSDSGTEVETPNMAQHTAQTLLSPAFQADANSAMRQVEHYHHDGRSNTGSSINSLGSNFSSQGNTGRTSMDTNPRNGPQGHHANAVRRRIGCVDHRLEICRLETFRQWPSNAAVRPEDLANSGFYYLGTDDRVQCAFCRGILRNWEPEDKPLAEHLRHFPQCPFLEDPTSAGNIQLGEEDDSIFSNVELRDTAGPVQHTYPNAGSVGIMTDRPNNQKYAMPQERLASFRDYPSNAVQSAEELTRAGFYYTNHTDTVKCFFCDVTVRNWRPNDDPWFVHARWSPRCGYVRMCKGDDFISDVQTKKNMSSRNMENYPRPNRRVKPAKKFKVTSEQLTNALDSVVVKAVLDMSFSEEIVKKVVKRRLQELGDDFPNPESLVDECTEFVDYSSDSESDMETEDDNTAEASKAPAQACAGEASTSADTNVQPPQLFASNLEEYTIEDEQKLLEETQRLKEDRQCKVCLDDPANIVFLKCGHLVCCQSCAPAMRHCPVCRNPILGTIKVDINN